MFSSVLPQYFDSEWSFAQCRLKDALPAICALKDSTLIAVSLEGNYYTAEIDMKNGGECTNKTQRPLIEANVISV